MASSSPEYGRVPLGDESESTFEDVPVEVAEVCAEGEHFEIEEPPPQVPPIRDDRLCSVKDPWFVTSIITLAFIAPTLLGATLFVLDLTGKIWPATPFALHLVITLGYSRSMTPPKSLDTPQPMFLFRLIPSLLDIWLLGRFYTLVWTVLIADFYTDLDGTEVVEFSRAKQCLLVLRATAIVAAVARAAVNGVSLSVLCYSRRISPNLPRPIASIVARIENVGSTVPVSRREKIRLGFRRVLLILMVPALGLLVWCGVSFCTAWINWSAPTQQGHMCDPLDTTECALPFPSFFHMVRDDSTATGYRVNLNPDALPPLKGGGKMNPAFLNELDGFSTMGPILFYLEGLKEADEMNAGTVHLQGPGNLERSITKESLTLLVDVDAQELVVHSAEIDYLDPDRPMVLMFPGQPLRHGTHYAVAVVGAVDVHGYPIPRTDGMRALFAEETSDTHRLSMMKNVVIPALEKAAPWVDGHDESLQLLFNFQTISAASQLGPVRAVRDATLKHVSSASDWGSWGQHSRLVRQDDFECDNPDWPIARTVHAEIDVPWFLEAYGPGHREAVLAEDLAVVTKSRLIGKAKFVAHIPCSLKAGALGAANATALRAVMEYGHSLLYNRNEASEDVYAQ